MPSSVRCAPTRRPASRWTVVVTMHQSNDNPFLCAWKDAGGVTNSWTCVALLMEGRTGSDGGDDVAPGLRGPRQDHVRRQLSRSRTSRAGRRPARRLAVELVVEPSSARDDPCRAAVTRDQGYRRAGAGTPLDQPALERSRTGPKIRRQPEAPRAWWSTGRPVMPRRFGGASPVLSLTRHLEAVRPGPGQRRHHDRVSRRRDPRPARRERVRQVDAAEHRQRQPRARQRHGRDRRRAAPVGVAGAAMQLGSAWRTSTSPRRRPDGRGEPVPRRTRRRPARLSPHVPVGDREDRRSVRARHRRPAPGSRASRRPAADARGRAGAAPRAEGAAARRADDSARPRRRPAPACAR